MLMANKTDRISTPSNEIIKNDYLVTAVKIMKIFDITRGTFDKWKKTKGFPKALFISKRQLWVTKEILDWAKSFDEEHPLWKLIDEK